MKHPLLTYAEQCVIPPSDRQSAWHELIKRYLLMLRQLRCSRVDIETLANEFVGLVDAFTLADSTLEQRIREAVMREGRETTGATL